MNLSTFSKVEQLFEDLLSVSITDTRSSTPTR